MGSPIHPVSAPSTLEKGSSPSLRLFPLRWPFGSSSLGEEDVRIEDEVTRNDAKPQAEIGIGELPEIKPNAYRKEPKTVEDRTGGHVGRYPVEIEAQKVVEAHEIIANLCAARRKDEVTLRAMEEQIQRAKENEQRALSELAEVKRQARAQIVKLRTMDEKIRKVKEAEERQKVGLETRRMENLSLRVTQADMRTAQEAERIVWEEKIRKAEEAEQKALRELANARQQTEHQPKAEGETSLATGTYVITNCRHRNAATLLNSNDRSSIVACNREGDRGELVRCNPIHADTQLTPCAVVC